MSACFGFRDKVVKRLSGVWDDDVRITGAGNSETTGLLLTAVLLSSVIGSLPPGLPKPQCPGLFHGETICLYPPDLSKDQTRVFIP